MKEPVLYRAGNDVVETFLRTLREDVNRLEREHNVRMTEDNEREFQNATACHLCKKSIERDVGDKVRNHDHVTGEYLGAAHNACNLNYNVPQHVPVFFHNLRVYDYHHLIQTFGKFKHEEIKCIATTSERYVSCLLYTSRCV